MVSVLHNMKTDIHVFVLCSLLGLSNAQFGYSNSYSAEQCASKLACSLNYTRVFDSKISELTYHHNLDLYKLRGFFTETLTPIQRDTEILKVNTSAMFQNFGREISNVYTTLGHDREFLNNLTRGVYDLGKSLHGEISVRMDDVHRLVVELEGVKNNLALLQAQVSNIKGDNAIGQAPQIVQQGKQCQADNDTVAELAELRQNNTFLERVYTYAADAVKRLTLTVADRDRQILSLQQKVQTLQNHTAGLLAPSHCDFPLGLENGTIPDSAITTSETHVNYNSAGARLNSQAGWYTNAKSRSHDWIQVDLGQKKHVTKVATQEAPCCDVRVTNYTIQFSQDGLQWLDYQPHCQKKYFDGNTDQASIKLHSLEPPIDARFVRINVADFHKQPSSTNNYVGMRVELYGCSVRT